MYIDELISYLENNKNMFGNCRVVFPGYEGGFHDLNVKDLDRQMVRINENSPPHDIIGPHSSRPFLTEGPIVQALIIGRGRE